MAAFARRGRQTVRVVRFACRPAGDLATLTNAEKQATTWNTNQYGWVPYVLRQGLDSQPANH